MEESREAEFSIAFYAALALLGGVFVGSAFTVVATAGVLLLFASWLEPQSLLSNADIAVVAALLAGVATRRFLPTAAGGFHDVRAHRWESASRVARRFVS